jgi:hypothetical protein
MLTLLLKVLAPYSLKSTAEAVSEGQITPTNVATVSEGRITPFLILLQNLFMAEMVGRKQCFSIQPQSIAIFLL